MTKELNRILRKIKDENKTHRVKITARKSSKEEVYWLSLSRHLLNGRKETRALKISLIDKSNNAQENRNNFDLAKESRDLMEAHLLKDENSGKIGSIKKKIIGKNFLDYFTKIADEKEQQNYRICRDHFIKFIGSNIFSINDVTNEVCRGFMQYLKGGGRTDRSAHNYFICFKAVLHSAVIDKIIKENPARSLRISYTKYEKTSLSMDQLRRLYNAPCRSKQLKNAFFFSCFTGLRKSDIKALTTDNIIDGYLVMISKKNKQPIRVKLKNTTLKIIEDQKKLMLDTIEYCQKRKIPFDDKRLFSIQDGGRSTKYLREWFKNASIVSSNLGGNKAYSFHTSRHTFVSLIVEYAGNVVAAQKLVGHQDIQTTQLYTHTDEKIKIEAIDSLPDLE